MELMAKRVHHAGDSLGLVPVLTEDGEVSHDVDRVFTAVAHAARHGDVVARNALYFAFESKITRFVRHHTRGVSFASRRVSSIEPADIAQEVFLVFADFVADWPGGESFASYFFSQFPRRLAAAVRRMRTHERRLGHPPGPLATTEYLERLTDGAAATEEALARLEALASDLPEPDRSLLLWRIRDGEHLGVIAWRLGVSRATVERAWKRLLAELRRSMEE